MVAAPSRNYLYSIIIAVHPPNSIQIINEDEQFSNQDFRLGEITVDWIDFTREKSFDKQRTGQGERIGSPSRASGSRKKGHSHQNTPAKPPPPGSVPPPGTIMPSTPTQTTPKKPQNTTPDSLSLQPLLAHVTGPNPLETSFASGVTEVGQGVVHLFRHAPPAGFISSLDSTTGNRGQSSKDEGGDWDGDRAEGADGSLIAILAVPAWMRPADFLEFIGGWATCLEGVRMIREATTPNRSIVLLKFRDALQASDFLVIFTGKAFSSLDPRETCHPIRVHHLILHKIEEEGSKDIAIPAFPPSVYLSRVRNLPTLLKGVPASSRYELPSCPVCLERLDSTVTGLVTLPCAHTFDCDCLRKWGDSRCPVCRVSHLLLSSSNAPVSANRDEITRLTKCAMCDSTERNWICVVCGVVGCGRYEPGKGHAREHWEESGHVLAMELETQRVWDYKGDNYVHRLIQTRNDGKLVELPSLSSLTSPIARPRPLPLSAPVASETSSTSTAAAPPDAGPSHNDMDKMSTIEDITLEYSYLLSSQLEAMRQHYEKEANEQRTKLRELEEIVTRAKEAERAREEAIKAKEKAEQKAAKATEVARSLQNSLSAEKALSNGLSERVKAIAGRLEKAEQEKKDSAEEVKSLNETVNDLMFSLEAGMKIQAAGGVDGGEGGDLVVVPGDEKEKKKKKKK